MSQTFDGSVEIRDTGTQPKVRVTLSGDSGSARFTGNDTASPLTIVSNSMIAIGKNAGPVAVFAATVVGGGIGTNPNLPTPGGVEVDTSKDPQSIITLGDTGHAGGIFVLDNAGKLAFKVNGVSGSVIVGGEGNGGEILLLNAKGETRVRLDGNTGDVELLGADCAEEFDLEAGIAQVEAGMVMVIGEGGRLQPSEAAYDKRVAGIISGAGEYHPGIVLHKLRTGGIRMPLALTGKAYCMVDASYAPVETGDMLTTSSTLGHAMKVADPLRAFGTVIGKALQPLRNGKGLIPVLVALQ